MNKIIGLLSIALLSDIRADQYTLVVADGQSNMPVTSKFLQQWFNETGWVQPTTVVTTAHLGHPLERWIAGEPGAFQRTEFYWQDFSGPAGDGLLEVEAQRLRDGGHDFDLVLFWMQGESDTANDERADSYGARLAYMLDSIREDFPGSRLRFVLGNIAYAKLDTRSPVHVDRIFRVRAGLEAVAASTPDGRIVETLDLQRKPDTVHLTTESRAVLAERMVAAWRDMVERRVEVQVEDGAGDIFGHGSSIQGRPAYISAASAPGYRFVGWKEGDEFLGDRRLEFPVEEDRNLSAVFEAEDWSARFWGPVGSDGAWDDAETAHGAVLRVDVDGDGDEDRISTGGSGGRVFLEMCVGEEVFATPATVFSGLGKAVELASGDFDGDGDQDLVAVDGVGGWVLWFENQDGMGGFSEGLMLAKSLQGAASPVVRDLDGDGDIDIRVRMGQHGRSDFLNRTIARDPLPLLHTFSIRPEWDGVSDPRFYLEYGGATLALLGSQAAYQVVPAELNGDALADAIVVGPGGGAPGAEGWVQCYFQDESGGLSAAPGPALSWKGDAEPSVETGDWDGDGDADIVLVDSLSVTIWDEEQGETTQWQSQVAGEELALVRIEDVDADGLDDLYWSEGGIRRLQWNRGSGSAGGWVPAGLIRGHMEPEDGGSVLWNQGVQIAGDEIQIDAVAAPGYRFSHWTGDGELPAEASGQIAAPHGVAVLTAHFDKVWPVDAVAEPPAGGVVSGSGVFAEGEEVRLRAVAAEGYVFAGWRGVAIDAGTSPEVSVVVDGLKSVTAVFISIGSDGDGDGMHDDWELLHFGSTSVDGREDFDGDLLTDRQEFVVGGDPKSADSDGDGYGDAWELAEGYDLNDAGSPDPDTALWGYAFGDVVPTLGSAGRMLWAEFPRRRDAAARGVEYGFQASVSGVAWVEPGEVEEEVEGVDQHWERVRLEWRGGDDAPRGFVRLRVVKTMGAAWGNSRPGDRRGSGEATDRE